MEKQEKKEKKILTENRLSTINKREVSFEGLVSQFENGEDGVYNLMAEEDKNVIFKPKITITKKDLEEIPELRQLREAISVWENRLKTATGKDVYIIKKTLIEMRREQYTIKNAFRAPVVLKQTPKSKFHIPLNESVTLDEQGYCIPHGVSLINPQVVCAVLCNYTKLKNKSHGVFDGDTWYFMFDFDNLFEKALSNYPLYKRLAESKIEGYQNIEIQEILEEEFGVKHSLEYISSLWRKKIPNLIASEAEDQYLDWYFLNIEKGQYKKCSRCGQIKLAHNKYFSKNKTSRDGFYSICKACRNQKTK